MYGLYIVIENDDARRTKVGPFTAEMREVISNTDEAHSALSRLMELINVPETSEGRPGMGSAQDGPLV